MSTIRDVKKWVCAEYLHTPALQLKAEQVQRLCGIGQTMCQLALDSLVASQLGAALLHSLLDADCSMR